MFFLNLCTTKVFPHWQTFVIRTPFSWTGLFQVPEIYAYLSRIWKLNVPTRNSQSPELCICRACISILCHQRGKFLSNPLFDPQNRLGVVGPTGIRKSKALYEDSAHTVCVQEYPMHLHVDGLCLLIFFLLVRNHFLHP